MNQLRGRLRRFTETLQDLNAKLVLPVMHNNAHDKNVSIVDGLRCETTSDGSHEDVLDVVGDGVGKLSQDSIRFTG